MSELTLPAGDSYAVYVGRRAERPFGGHFYITYDGEDTDLISNDASLAEIDRALNKLPAIVATGGVSVSRLNGDICKVTFLQKGARDTFVANGNSLFPKGEGVFTVIQTGSASEYHVVAFKLRQLPIGECLAFTAEPACAAEVEQLRPDIWDIYLTSDAKDGYFVISVDGGADIEVSVFEDYSTLEAKLPAGFSVAKAGDFRWRIQKDDGSAFLPAIESDSDIISFSGVQGTLVMTDGEADEFLSGKAYAGAFLEINRQNVDGSQLVVQTPCNVLNRIYT